ncbi:hypothetical protein [Aliivibrio fischeri]|uniref:hypothetical protein n=1 Tax=Aliivibrio fischeri TaxID=668 RepID=UPI00080E2174|nr:hypothetical protein [Aliivibrio fischeri]OCH40330.1 hypothetical protein A6E02_17450 [Aliivibrio fischeri]
MIDIDALSGCEITALIEKIGYDNLASFCNKDEFISRLSNETLLDAIVNDNERDIEDIVIKLCSSLLPFSESKTHKYNMEVLITLIKNLQLFQLVDNKKETITDSEKQSLAQEFHNDLLSVSQNALDDTEVMFTQIMDKLISKTDESTPQGEHEKTRLTRFKKFILAEKFNIEALSILQK